MPGFNQMGPTGNGPMTGRKMGQCAGANNCRGRGLGIGRNASFGPGIGRGRGFGFNQFTNYNTRALTPEDEKMSLKDEKEFYESQLNEITKRLEEL